MRSLLTPPPRSSGRRRATLACVSALLALVTSVAAAEPSLDVDQLDRRLEALERDERALETSLENAESEARRVHQRVVARGRAYYRLSRGGPRGEGWMSHAVRVERLRRGLLRDLERGRELERRRREENRKLTLLRERKEPLVAERSNLHLVRDALLSQKEREHAFQQAFAETRAAPHTAIYSAGVGPTTGTAEGFASMRGRLPFPVPGRTEIEEVRRRWADGPGLVLRAPVGTPVRAVFAGRVAFADSYADYGRTIILDHGDGYYSVSANLGSFDVRVGDDLAAGSRLGTVGLGGGGGELYLEIRQGTDTLRPADWFGI